MTTAPSAPGRIDIGSVLEKVFDTYGKTFTVLIPANHRPMETDGRFI